MKYRASREGPKFNGNERFVWPAIKRDIDESIEAQENTSSARSEAGKLGGRPKAKKANAFSESKKSYGQGQGQGQISPPDGGDSARTREDPALAAVISAYANKINPCPSEACIGELKGFAGQMGADCCLRAMDIALDEKKTSWSYIRAILRDKLKQGVRCLADWDKLEEGRKRNGAVEHQDSAQSAGSNGTKWNIKSALNDDD